MNGFAQLCRDQREKDMLARPVTVQFAVDKGFFDALAEGFDVDERCFHTWRSVLLCV